jgi:hypothetical protein
MIAVSLPWLNLLAVLLLFVPILALAQQQAALVPPTQTHTAQQRGEFGQNIRTSFSFPLRSWWEKPVSVRDIFTKELSGNVAFNEPLLPASTPANGLGAQGDPGSTSRNISISVKDSPITFWYLQTTFDIYFQPDLKRAWNPDFTYSFGYDDWHPYTFSLTYSNYGGNRFAPNYSEGESITPLQVERSRLEPKGAKFNWATHYTVVPRYEDLASNKIQDWKQSASLSCTNTVYKFFYWTLTAIKYPYRSQEQPWDPDYTYGFGYFDYRRGRFSIEYNNYSGNRYPWRASGKTAATFRSGGVSVFWNFP